MRGWCLGASSGMDHCTGAMIKKSQSMDNMFGIALIFRRRWHHDVQHILTITVWIDGMVFTPVSLHPAEKRRDAPARPRLGPR